MVNIFFFFYSGNCTNCSTEHGKCVKGFCECEDGWEGATCEQKGESYYKWQLADQVVFWYIARISRIAALQGSPEQDIGTTLSHKASIYCVLCKIPVLFQWCRLLGLSVLDQLRSHYQLCNPDSFSRINHFLLHCSYLLQR